MIIVIDGPAGSGKSSTAKALSNRLNLHFLDSGALYRAVTYFWISEGKPSTESFFKMLPGVDLKADVSDGSFLVMLNETDISNEIRKSEVADNVSNIASLPEVRQFVNSIMRDLVSNGEFIADGRDLGTAVFPDADLKFYMDASIEERARRRYKELSSKQDNISFEDVVNNLKSRDQKDRSRKADPLKKADDAIVINTTGKTFEEQVDLMAAIIHENLKLNH
ncbi:(d)CMP kinase [Rhodohalobacter sp. SW132]|uniref:(d)CMP kinase n=1 Tax=Rhodohalobacter sp. SW132 TaxID=2293433 RepID=UPI000E27F15A|nr:(d)CMP kinase [Rhodohalobacter sp. SW132]REL33216.1 (d)CMP kinase [Rhodohalobacter sp. SW132]